MIQNAQKEKRWPFLAFGVANAALIVSIIILSCVPPVSRDALIHHLAVPKLYLSTGGIHEIPSVVFSYYPMNLDLLYMIPLYFGNDIVPKFIHFFFGLCTAWLLFSYLKKRAGSIYGWIGVFLFLSVPVIVKLSVTVYVDLGLIFFSMASLLQLFKWIEHGFRTGHLILAGIFCGLALGTKYNGLVILFLLTLFVPFIYSRLGSEMASSGASGKREGVFSRNTDVRAAGFGLLFFLTALLVFSPWMIRNALWTGNPVHPLYNGFFESARSKTPDLENDEKKASKPGWGPFMRRRYVFHESFFQTLLIPLRVFFEGKDGDPKYFDGKLNPYLLVLPFFAFWGARTKKNKVLFEKRILAVFSILLILITYLKTDMRIRYISPAIPSLVILSVFGLKCIHESLWKRKGARRVFAFFCFGLFFFLVGMNLKYIGDQFRYIQPFSYIFQNIDRDAYIAKYRSEYPVMKFINRNLAPDAKILAFFLGYRRYYCDRDIDFSTEVFKKAVNNASNPGDIQKKLNSLGFSHILMQEKIFRNWVGNNFDPVQQRLITDFFMKYFRPVFSNEDFVLFQEGGKR